MCVLCQFPIVNRLSVIGNSLETLESNVLFWLQAFILTFLAEWGDRSQIATIAVGYCSSCRNSLMYLTFYFVAIPCISYFIEGCDTPEILKLKTLILPSVASHVTMQLATHKNAIGVAVGASLGHTACTSLAVIGGSMLASKISQRTVATIGGVLFLGFSVSSYFYPPLWWKGTVSSSHLDFSLDSWIVLRLGWTKHSVTFCWLLFGMMMKWFKTSPASL